MEEHFKSQLAICQKKLMEGQCEIEGIEIEVDILVQDVKSMIMQCQKLELSLQ